MCLHMSTYLAKHTISKNPKIILGKNISLFSSQVEVALIIQHEQILLNSALVNSIYPQVLRYVYVTNSIYLTNEPT